MRNSILVGQLPMESMTLLEDYIKAKAHTTDIDIIQPNRVKASVTMGVKQPSVVAIILDEDLYNKCSVLGELLTKPKVHHYRGYDKFKLFLIEKFGPLEEDSGAIPPPDKLYNEPVREPIQIKDNSEELQKLKDEIAKKDMLITNLNMQLQGNSASDEEVKELVSRIRELETELNNKSGNDSALQSQLDDLLTKQATWAYEKSSLESKVNEYETKLTEVDNLRGMLSSKDAELQALKETLSSKDSEFASSQAELGVLQSRVEENQSLSLELDKVKKELSNTKLEYDNIKAELDSKNNSYQDSINKVKQLESELEDKSNLIKTMQNDSQSDTSTIEDLTKRVSSLKKSCDDYESKIAEQTNVIAEKDEKIKAINLKLSQNLADNELIAEKDTEIEELKAKITQKDTEIEKVKETITQKVTLERSEEIASLTGKIAELNTKVTEVNEEKLKLVGELKAEKLLSEEYKTKLANNSLESVKLVNQIDSLTKSLADASTGAEQLISVKEKLLNEQRKTSKLETDLATERGISSSLKTDVANLEAKLKNIEFEIENNDAMVAEFSNRTAELEMELMSKENEIEEISNSIFGKMANVAAARYPYNLVLPISPQIPDKKFVLFASGSDESSSNVYTTIRKFCEFNKQSRILICDFVTDSRIDAEFGTGTITTPIPWLEGADGFAKYVAKSKFNNVRILSTAQSYMNDLFLIDYVDWEKRLAELANVGDYVFINIGCLNNIVAKVLFNTFSKFMNTKVITKSSPVEIRSTALNLAGLGKLNANVTTLCVDFDESTSKNMFTNLSNSYKTQIVRKQEVMKL